MNAQAHALAPARLPDLYPGDPDPAPAVPARAAPGYTLADLEQMARHAAASNLFGLQAAQAFTLMLVAMADGLHPVEALRRYHVIEGRPAMRADAMQAEFQRRGGCLRWLARTATECTVEAWHPTLHPDHLRFSVTLAELVDSRVACTYDQRSGQWRLKSMYQKFPRQMLHARAVSEMVRAIDPGVVVGVYTPEEVRDAERDVPMPRPWDRDRGGSGVEAAGGAGPGRSNPLPIGPAAPRPPAARPIAAAPAIAPGVGDADAAAEGAELRDFVRREIRAATDELANAVKLEGRDRGKVAPVCNGHQVFNALVTMWGDEGLIDPADVAGPDGRRRRDLTAVAVDSAYRHDPEEVREGVRCYIRHKRDEAFRAAGLEPPGDRDEAQATADEDGDDGEVQGEMAGN